LSALAKNQAKTAVRWLTLQVLRRVILQKRSLSSVLQQVQSDVSPQDKSLLYALSYGVVRWYIKLDTLVHSFLAKPFKTKDQDIAVLLVLGVYQLLYTRIPPHAAISETVALCRRLHKPWATGLVNAVLRGVQRQQEHLTVDVEGDLVVQTSHPLWLVDFLKAAWPDDYLSVLMANNDSPPMVLRVNQGVMTRADYLVLLAKQGMDAMAGVYGQSSIYLSQPVDVDRLPGFDKGWCSVQDEAAQLAADLLDLSPGCCVLDACAAPGG